MPADPQPVPETSSARPPGAEQTAIRNLKSLMDSSVIGILFWDLDDPTVLDANAEYLRIVGHSRADLLAGRVNWQVLTLPEFRAQDVAVVAELNRTGQHQTYEKEYQRPDGQRVPVLLGGSFSEPGTRKGVSFCLDLTTQRAAQRQAEVREREFTALVNTVAQLAWMANPDGHIFWYNDRWYEYTGTTLDEMLGWGWSKVHHPDHIERVLEQVRPAWGAGQPFELTFPLRGHDGSYRWFLTRAVPILDAQGQVLRWFGTNTDVTEMRQLQDQLERSYQDLEVKVTFRTLQLEQQVRELQAQLAAR